MRLILTMVDSPHCSIVHCLVEILEPVRRDNVNYSLEDNFKLVDAVEDMNISHKFLLGVSSLFTNVTHLEIVVYWRPNSVLPATTRFSSQ